MVEELLRNSLDKAYGKQGNPCSPGSVNSQAAPLPRALDAGRALRALPGPGLPPAPAQAPGGASGTGQRHLAKGVLGVPQGGVLEWGAPATGPEWGPCAGGCTAQGSLLTALLRSLDLGG